MKILNLAAAAMLFAGAPVYAANARCDNCDSWAAETMAQSMGLGDHVVFSLSQDVAYAYTNECDPFTHGSNPETISLCVFPRILSSDEAEEFAMARQIYVQTGGRMKFERVVPISDIGFAPGLSLAHLSAHDFARRPADWHRLSMGVAVHGTTLPGLLNSAGARQTTGSILGVSGTQIEITVQFICGGKVTYKVDFGDETMAEQIGPIRDADGNVIPTPSDNPTTMSGFYAFSSANAQNAMNVHLSALGWAMRFPQPTAVCPNIGRLIYECGWVGGDMRNVSCKMLTRC